MLTAAPERRPAGPTNAAGARPRPATVCPVTAVNRDELPRLAELAAEAAMDTSVGRWLVPEAGQRSAVLHAWYFLLLSQALRYGRIDMLADRTGLAAWIDRTGPVPDLRGALRRLTASCGKHTITLLGYHHLLQRTRPSRPHLELAVLAAPDATSMARLLAYRHRRLDPAGIGTYAVADTPQQRDRLATAGYQTGPPVGAGAGVLLSPMWRPPIAARPTA